MSEALEASQQGDAEAEGRFRSAAKEYLELLTEHIQKEDCCLFPMGDQAMSGADRSSLCGRFCEVGHRAIEGMTREALERIAAELERQWP